MPRKCRKVSSAFNHRLNYTGGYGIDACRNDIESSGDGIGDITDNFELTDQYGDTVRLHDFCERAVLLVSAAFW